MQNRPLYTIGIMANLLGVHPETLRVWERQGLIKAHRRNGRRLYTEGDLKRLFFIQELLDKGLNFAGISKLLSFYPCWLRDDCPSCMRKSNNGSCAKQCWKEKGIYCQVALQDASTCDTCEYRESDSEQQGVIRSTR